MVIPRREFSGAPDLFVNPPFRSPMKQPITQSQLNELFALKRQERPPENFMTDFIKEFHRRMEATSPKYRRSSASNTPASSSPLDEITPKAKPW